MTDADADADAAVDGEVRARLRETAGEHRPDRAYIRARVARGMAAERAGAGHPGPARGPGARGRWAVVTAAAAGALAVAALALIAPRGTTPHRTVAASPEPARPSPAEAPEVRSTPGAVPPGTPVTPTPSRGPAGAPAPARESGFLRASGAVDPDSGTSWAQSDITVRTEHPLTSLTVELRVAATGGVTDAGSWRTLPERDVTVSVTARDGGLVYRWTLRAGVTVPAGEHVFAGQYHHTGGRRDAGADRFTVRATASGTGAEVTGGFTPAPGGPR
ncbi:hypothetical protein AB0O07_07330 [Streptomyces sp. NPDC093085]|uniref:hypothetical protein n=1 Tax=Streptomyces sp. NPDC093085 TaxID=3155068 RepID=UPI003424803E